MTFFEILSTILIGPLKLIFEIIYSCADRLVPHAGLSIIVLSVVMNCLLLPLYRRTDIIQEAARDTEEKLREGVEHIKKSFSGDERMMILQTYYRQNNYKPTDALNGSVSLLLEVPFFMAAYQFLSGLQLLEGVSFGPIRDLSAPDALIVIGGITLNALPIIMTLVNVVSSAIYLKGFPLKTKLQLYAMALFFLVFLYESPSGLVMYWTMNNLFSLGKTLFYKLKNPLKAAIFGISAMGILVGYYALFLYDSQSMRVKYAAIILAVMMQIPLILLPFAKKLKEALPVNKPKPNRKLFILGVLFLTILTGLLIPSTYIAASPQEFVDMAYYHNPLWYCVSSTCLAAGMFLVWLNVFYWLANDTGKAVFDKLVWVLCGVMIVNYMFFGTNMGVISSSLQYEGGLNFSRTEQLINILVLLAVGGCTYMIATKWSKTVLTILLTAVIALGSMSAINLFTINASLNDLEELNKKKNDLAPHFELSTTGENVIVIMLDRASSEYVPYIMKEKPELIEQFDGFTYYQNTISFGGTTNFASPALFGGYEYTPVELNKRSSESLASKQNEALKVMPMIFSNHGYDVTVCDPVYANYNWLPNTSIYDDHPQIHAYVTKGKFGDVEHKKVVIENNHRNFFCFSLMKTMPLALQPLIYNAGVYNEMNNVSYSVQICAGLSRSNGLRGSFLDAYNVLVNLPQMSRITDDETNTFLLLENETTHEPSLLQTPNYIPAETVDNTAYDAQNADRFVIGERTLQISGSTYMQHYHASMATFLQMGKWFDYLRENGVYDNTRIILVSDHGWTTNNHDELQIYDDMGIQRGVEVYYPLLMVKDFNSKGFTVSDAFMTNADVPTLAMDRLIENPVNPFTDKAITSDEKYAHDQIIIVSDEWDVTKNNGTTFLPSIWASVKDNIWDKGNWEFSNVETVLTEHKLP